MKIATAYLSIERRENDGQWWPVPTPNYELPDHANAHRRALAIANATGSRVRVVLVRDGEQPRVLVVR